MNYNGAKMKSALITKTLEDLYNLPAFAKVKNDFKRNGVNPEDLNVALGYQFNTFPEQEEVKYTRYVQLHNNQNTAQIVFSVTEPIKGQKEYTLISNFKKEEKQNGNIVVAQNVLRDKEVIEKELLFDTENYNQLFEETHVEEDINFAAFEEPIKAQWSFSGCAPGIPHYEHCGPGCGIGLTYGGGTPINSTDTCCRGHDACWKMFGNGDACCDKEFLKCLEGKTTVTADIAQAWFSSNAKKC
ncbi:hypothetical protein [Solibacillus isronensis]|uniref:hypothetical protein n=1 Tax=Solibacillus isronensis TaxID=412383 RepID=UPI0039A17DFC